MAFGCLAVAAVALFFVVRLADRTFFLPQAGLVKSPAVLADKAEHLMTALGHAVSGQEHWQGFAIDRECLEYAARTEDRQQILESLPSGRPPAVCFWYRAGAERISLPALLGEPSGEMFPAESDMVTVRLDGRGRLLQYMATAERAGLSQAAAPPVDWSALLAMTGLPIADFQPIHPVPRTAHVCRFAGGMGRHRARRTRNCRSISTGASVGGRVVFFEVLPPWEPDWTDADEGLSRLPRPMPDRPAGVELDGHPRRRLPRLAKPPPRTRRPAGAGRLVVFILLLGLLDWLLGERHVAVFGEELAQFYVWMARATLTAAIAWVSYFAVEPYVRRYWPQTMITWSRALGGKFRDPLVGRDVLIGGTCGILLVLVVQLEILLARLARLAAAAAQAARPDARSGRRAGSAIQAEHLDYRADEQHYSDAGRAAVDARAARDGSSGLAGDGRLVAAADRAPSGHIRSRRLVLLADSPIMAAVAMALLMRVGIVALVACSFFWFLMVNSPVTSNFQAWYAPAGTCAVVLAAGLLVYGFLMPGQANPSSGIGCWTADGARRFIDDQPHKAEISGRTNSASAILGLRFQTPVVGRRHTW